MQRSSTLFIAGCFNCNDTGLLLKDCAKPLNIARAAVRKLHYPTKRKKSNAIHVVLVNLCHQLDDNSLKNNSFESNDDDAKIFDNLLAKSFQDHGPEIFNDSGNDDIDDGFNDAITDIYEVVSKIKLAPSDCFEVACINSSAQRTVIVKCRAKLYSIFASVKVELPTLTSACRFGNISREVCCKVLICLRTNWPGSLNQNQNCD